MTIESKWESATDSKSGKAWFDIGEVGLWINFETFSDYFAVKKMIDLSYLAGEINGKKELFDAINFTMRQFGVPT